MPRFVKAVLYSAILSTAAVSGITVWADDSTPINPGETGTPVQQAAPAGANSPPSQVSPAPDNSVPSAPVSEYSGPPEAGPGPLLEKRRALLTRIMAAKKQGIGISAYMSEFTRIEGLVKTSQPTTAYESRLDSLSDSLDDQLKRSQILKTQRPVMKAPEAASATAMTRTPGPPMSGMPSGGSSDGMMDLLKQRFGNKMGAGGLGALDKMSPEEKQKLMQSDMAKQLMKKYLGN
jgi:hypothetical protein